MDTLLLDPSAWDLVLDANGNIAIATQPYAIAQDVASACKLFLGELYYDNSKGVPYFETILGEKPPISFIKSKFEEAALTVPGVVLAKCYLQDFKNRKLTGQIQVTDINGTTTVVNL
jgi:hypothetical protein